jgi:hypothetical protein
LKFLVRDARVPIEEGVKDTVVLLRSNWDDWFQFETTFYADYYDQNGKVHDIGQVKVGRKRLRARG